MGVYYQKHCETLERQLRYGESQGIQYMALTASRIPALAARYHSSEPANNASLR